jgi:C1A family cysteine protease
MKTQYKYDLRPSPQHILDFGFERLVRETQIDPATPLPAITNNRAICPPVLDQEAEGSCTANAVSGAIQFNEIVKGIPLWLPSRQFEYYNSRSIDGDTMTDSGSTLRASIQALAQYGICPEDEYPYRDSDGFFNALTKPPQQCYTDALPNAIRSYYALHTLTDMKTCLANKGNFVFGFTVYESFEDKSWQTSGVMPMPIPAYERKMGGHAVRAVDFDDSKQAFLVANSWGVKFALQGYWWMSYEIMLKYGFDWWTFTNRI